jgi:hypothetical protein
MRGDDGLESYFSAPDDTSGGGGAPDITDTNASSTIFEPDPSSGGNMPDPTNTGGYTDGRYTNYITQNLSSSGLGSFFNLADPGLQKALLSAGVGMFSGYQQSKANKTAADNAAALALQRDEAKFVRDISLKQAPDLSKTGLIGGNMWKYGPPVARKLDKDGMPIVEAAPAAGPGTPTAPPDQAPAPTPAPESRDQLINRIVGDTKKGLDDWKTGGMKDGQFFGQAYTSQGPSGQDGALHIQDLDGQGWASATPENAGLVAGHMYLTNPNYKKYIQGQYGFTATPEEEAAIRKQLESGNVATRYAPTPAPTPDPYWSFNQRDGK